MINCIYQGCLAFWLGALLAIDIVETPARVFTDKVPRAYKFAIGARVFRWSGWMQVLLGVLLVAISMSLTKEMGRGNHVQFYGPVAMLILTVLQAVWLGPSMSNRMIFHAGENGGLELELASGFTISHSFYIGVDAAKAVLLVCLMFKA